MALIKTICGKTPTWGADCYFSENATIVGDVIMGDQCTIWFNAVVRGDVNYIRIGNRVNIQDGSCPWMYRPQLRPHRNGSHRARSCRHR